MFLIRSQKKTKSYGFTIPELAIVLVISSIMFAALLQALKVYTITTQIERTRQAIEEAAKSLEGFVSAETMLLPCPANPAVLPGSPEYGREDCTLAEKTSVYNSELTGKIRIGNFPKFYSLGGGKYLELYQYARRKNLLSFNYRDAWGRDLKYAVASSMSKPSGSTANEKFGVIKVEDEYGRVISGADRGAYYIIWSQGPKGCPSSSPTEAKNCDDDAVFVSGIQKMADSTNYFDDIVYFKTSSRSDLWSGTGVSNTARNLNSGNVGIHTTAPDQKLTVGGDVVAGKAVDAKFICNTDKSQCVDPGSLSNIKCDPDADGTPRYVRGIRIDWSSISKSGTGKFTADCAKLKFKTANTRTCVYGIEQIHTDGTVVCACMNRGTTETPIWDCK